MLRASPLARVALLPRRYREARAADTWSRGRVLRWLATSREHTNFTYDLTPSSQLRLAAFVGDVLRLEPERVRAMIAELHDDKELVEHVALTTRRSRFRHVADPVARYGRRAGWYAFVRLARPRLVVETGVDKGLGACVIAAALLRNAAEGASGRYVGIDLDPSAGWLVTAPYANVATVRFGDSIALLAGLDAPVDLFIHDSDHTPSYERAEYRAVSGKLAECAIVLSDNAHATRELEAFADKTGRTFAFWREETEHWYPGAGIGAAWRRSGASATR